MRSEITLGATYLGDGRCKWLVWAPLARTIDVHILSPQERVVSMTSQGLGYHQAIVEGVQPGSRYVYRLDGDMVRPDPVSRFQPDGVHGPSQVVDPAFPWSDGCWSGLRLQDYVLYELHVGTFTPEGAFDAIISHLDELKDLGVTAVELMPVAQFPGRRNWGYDGVYLFAVQNSYGGPGALKRLVDACHQRGLAVVLDVVYNHVGPEGNYLGDFGYYFTDRYRTPWGKSINFDGPHSDEVRRFFLENALYWITEFHIDSLRLDALHAILDFSAFPFLEELATQVHEVAERLGRRVYLIAETDQNDAKLIRPRELGGYGLDAQWNDDFHHALHTLLTGEQAGYYKGFGKLQDLVKAVRDGYVYSGQFSPYRMRRHGNSSRLLDARQFVVCSQNHDQVGNRLLGERLSRLVSFEGLKLAAGVVVLSPYIPLLFMGEEYGETAPFQYFMDHSDTALIDAVRRGRQKEFTAFKWQGEIPDPQCEETFAQAKLNHNLREAGGHRELAGFYRELFRLRKALPALALLSKDHVEVFGFEGEQCLLVRRWIDDSEVVIIFHFGDTLSSVTLPVPEGRWQKVLDSAEERWHGSGTSLPEQLDSKGEATLALSPQALVLFMRDQGA
jgi:maltooligosyltrehalose trehalohydrolase